MCLLGFIYFYEYSKAQDFFAKEATTVKKKYILSHVTNLTNPEVFWWNVALKRNAKNCHSAHM